MRNKERRRGEERGRQTREKGRRRGKRTGESRRGDEERKEDGRPERRRRGEDVVASPCEVHSDSELESRGLRDTVLSPAGHKRHGMCCKCMRVCLCVCVCVPGEVYVRDLLLIVIILGRCFTH